MDRRIAHDEDIVPDSQTKQLTFNPFNPKNVQIELHEVNQLLKRYGVAGNVGSLHLYRRAFVHSSYCERPYLEGAPHVFQPKCPANCLPLCAKSNERLEFLGDGVLELVAKYYLYRRFSKENEGFMTEKKIALVRNDAIGKLALDMGLDRWFVMSKHNEDKKCRSKRRPSTLSSGTTTSAATPWGRFSASANPFTPSRPSRRRNSTASKISTTCART